MNKLRIPILLFFLTLGSTACAMSAPGERAAVAPQSVEFQEFSADDEFAAGNASTADRSLAAPSERIVIRNANLALVVSDPAESSQSIARMAEEMGGFVVSSNVYKTTFDGDVEADQASITVRVPFERLDEALERIKQDAIEVQSEYVSGQDVTEEFTDRQSELRNLQDLEEELREYLRASTRTEDALAVFDRLERIRRDIEVIKGRLQYLQESARLSALSVELIPDVAEQPLRIGRWQPQGTAKTAFEALLRTLETIVEVVIWIIIYILPVGLVIAIPVWLLVRLYRRIRPARRPKETHPKQEAE